MARGRGRRESRKRVACSSTDNMPKMKVTLIADEWLSTKGGLSTVNRELAIQLAKDPLIEVSLFMEKCSKEEKELARQHNVKVLEATGKDPDRWWTSPPPNFATDFIIGHSCILGEQAKHIREYFECKWVQVVHTDPEELGSYKGYAGANATGEKKFKKEVELCKIADFVVGIGPKLADVYQAKLRRYKKEVFTLTPSFFRESSEEEQAQDEGKTFRVLVFGRGDTEDISLKGFDLAAEAVAELQDESYHLIFVGVREGEHDEVKERLLQQGHRVLAAHQLKVREYITSRDELVETLFESDLAIMPSRSEGFGLTALEALSAGLPILVGNNTGFAEAIQDVFGGETCIVDSYEAKDWADRIKKVQKTPRKKRLNHARRLCEEFKKRYSWEKQCRSLVKEMQALNRDPEEEKEGSPFTKRCRVDSPDDVDGDDSDGHAHGDDKSSDDDDDDDDDNKDGDGEVETEGDGSHGDRRKEKEEKEHEDLSKSKQKSSFSLASVSSASPPEEAPQLVFKEGKPSNLELMELAGKIASKWETLGLYLGIEQEVVEGIAANEKDKPYEMLLYWSRNIPSSTQYRQLYNALCERRVGFSNLARDFCYKKTA